LATIARRAASATVGRALKSGSPRGKLPGLIKVHALRTRFFDGPLGNLQVIAGLVTMCAAGCDGSEPDSPEWRRPSIDFPQAGFEGEFFLSETGLYQDMVGKVPAPDLVPFAPDYFLWSDGAQKQRWVYIPPGQRIDTSDSDHWQVPIGALAFKEFSRADRKLETRLIARTGSGRFDYWMGAFVWLDDESDAVFVPHGSQNVRGTDHDVPSASNCEACHNGEPGRLLGFSAAQLSKVDSTLARLADEGILSQLPAAVTNYAVPGDEAAAAALGYLHANCAHCHNPNGIARADTDMNLRLEIGQGTLEETNVYQTTVGIPLQFFDGSGLVLRVDPGKPERSAIPFRMGQRGTATQMPPLATEAVDEVGLATVRAWIASLR
jgi:hypothetical protein